MHERRRDLVDERRRTPAGVELPHLDLDRAGAVDVADPDEARLRRLGRQREQPVDRRRRRRRHERRAARRQLVVERLPAEVGADDGDPHRRNLRDRPHRPFCPSVPARSGRSRRTGRPRSWSTVGAVTVLGDHVDERSEAFQANRAHLLALLAEHDRQLALVNNGGGDKYIERHRQRGKLLCRERVELLVDRDAPLLELSPLAAWGSDFPVGAGVFTGIGVVEDVECVIIANDPTVRGGTSTTWTVKKTLRAMEIARENRLPLLYLVESGGADLPHQSEIFIPGGETFRNLTRLSGAAIPTIAIVFGNSTAGGAYVPGMCDHVVMIEQRSKVFLGGPPLVKMATGEESDDESLGGADMHARVSGLADHFAVDEVDALRIGRRIVRRLNHRKLGPPPRGAGRAAALRRRAADRHPVGRPAHPVRPPRRARPHRRRQRLRRVQAALRLVARHRLGRAARLSDRRPRQPPRRAVQRGVAQGGAVHPARQRDRHAAAVPAEHDRLHGRARVRAAGHGQGRLEDDQRRQQLARCRTSR